MRRLRSWLFRRAPGLRRLVARGWYGCLARLDRGGRVRLMNYGHDAGAGLELRPEEEPDRYGLQLYDRVVGTEDLHGRELLEIGCGRGGGTAWLHRTAGARLTVGLDRARGSIRFCRREHVEPGLSFRQGDAERLPFEAESFDVVVNVESSHCYRDVAGFLAEVRRVLRPSGRFLYADYRRRRGLEDWERTIAACGMTLVRKEDITAGVVAALRRDSDRRAELVRELAPSWMRRIAREFAGGEDTRILDAFASGACVYRRFVLAKPPRSGESPETGPRRKPRPARSRRGMFSEGPTWREWRWHRAPQDSSLGWGSRWSSPRWARRRRLPRRTEGSRTGTPRSSTARRRVTRRLPSLHRPRRLGASTSRARRERS